MLKKAICGFKHTPFSNLFRKRGFATLNYNYVTNFSEEQLAVFSLLPS